jgi:hypothetical protein
MKFILVPILMMLVLAQTFSKCLVVLEYNLNKDFISQRLCINKVKPQMHCNGKCQMMKRLAQEENENASNTTKPASKIKVQELVLSDETYRPVLPLVISSTLSYNEEAPFFIHQAPSLSIFHPPALS